MIRTNPSPQPISFASTHAPRLELTKDPRSLVTSILRKYPYGPKGLEAATPELRSYGIEPQIDSSGAYRGRLFLPDGNRVDVCAQNESMNWWSDQRGTEWGWTERGVDSGAPAAGQSDFCANFDSDPLGMNDPFMTGQRELAKIIEQQKNQATEQVLRDLLAKIRLQRIEV